LRLCQPQDKAKQGEAQRCRSGQIDVGPLLALRVAGYDARRRDDRDHGQRDVHQQHGAPAQRRGQDAADGWAEGAGHGGRAAHEAQGPALFRAAVGRAHDRHRVRQHQRAACPLQDPEREQDRKGRGQPAERRSPGEHGGADQEDPAAPEQITQTPAKHQQRRKREQAAVEHPLHLLAAHRELVQDGRQRQRDRGLVDQHHGVGQRHAQEQQLAPVPPSAHALIIAAR